MSFIRTYYLLLITYYLIIEVFPEKVPSNKFLFRFELREQRAHFAAFGYYVL
jgi:hypothetical protein